MNRTTVLGISVLLIEAAVGVCAGAPPRGGFQNVGLRSEGDSSGVKKREPTKSWGNLARVVLHRVDLKGASIAEALDFLVREGEKAQLEGLGVRIVLTPGAALSTQSKTSLSFKEEGLILVDVQK